MATLLPGLQPTGIWLWSCARPCLGTASAGPGWDVSSPDMNSMNERAAALCAWLHKPAIQDIGLAALLLAGTWAWSDADIMLRKFNGLTPGAPWPVQLQIWWVATGICVVAVVIRRRWPVAALAAAVLAAVTHIMLIAGPALADLAAPITLYTIASRYRRTLSLASLGITLLVTASWSGYIRLDGRYVGWTYASPATDTANRPARGGLADGPVPGPKQRQPDLRKKKGHTALPPTDWGGLPVLGSILVAGWAIGSSAMNRRAYLDQLTARARDLEREHDQQAALAAAAERSRITRELHDVVAHGLSVIVMQAQGGAAAFDKRPAETRAALATIVETGRASLADMRQVLAAVGSVDGSPHPVPGLDRLLPLIDQVRQAGTPVQLHIQGTPAILPTTVDLSSYRIIQEALTNTMKHAGPEASAQVTLTYGKKELRLHISDNGTARPDSAGIGNGLRGMRERAELLRGELVAGPGPHGGFVIQARLPLAGGPTR